MFCQGETKPLEHDAATANRFLQTFTQRYAAPAKVFCSRELENGMTEYVKRELQTNGVFPSDEKIRQRAQEVMSMQKTPCDDPVLLGKFKALMQNDVLRYTVATTAPAPAASVITANPLATIPGIASGGSSVTGASDNLVLPTEMDLTLTEQEMNNIIEGVNNEFGDGSLFNQSPSNHSVGSGSRMSL